MRRRTTIALLAMLMTVGMVVSAGPAAAGEITGKCAQTVDHEDWEAGGDEDCNPWHLKDPQEAHGALNGHSLCAFSGLNDEWDWDDEITGDGFGRTQSWGQAVKLYSPGKGASVMVGAPDHPGNACNPTIGLGGH